VTVSAVEPAAAPAVEAATTLPEEMPAATLGWDVVRWCEQWLMSPMGDGSRLSLTAEQIRFIAHWYAVDEAGQWRWRRGVLRRAKGWGKDPLAAIVALVELLGPCRFGGWDDDGRPVAVGEPTPLVAVCATSKEQTLTTTSLLRVVAGAELVKRHRLKLGVSGLSRGRTDGGQLAQLKPMTKAWRTAEGDRVTACIASETQHWREADGGLELAAVIRRNLSKRPGGAARLLAITNAHEPGEESVAEADHDAWQAQQDDGGGDILLDDRHAVVGDDFDVRDRDAMIPALRAVYGDSVWVDLERQAKEAADPSNSEAHVRRFLLNRITAGSARWMDPQLWEDRWLPDRRLPDAGSVVTVGFDGSRHRDATAIVCTCWETGFQWVAGLWERDWSLDDWEVDAAEVEAVMEQVFSTWRVARAYADPAWWKVEVDRWCGRWEQMAGWWMHGGEHLVRVARAVTSYREAVAAPLGLVSMGELVGSVRGVSWGGPHADRFRSHVLAAVRRDLSGHRGGGERQLHTIAKAGRSSRRCIDAAVAAVLSWEARSDAVAAGWEPDPDFEAHRHPSLTDRLAG